MLAILMNQLNLFDWARVPTLLSSLLLLFLWLKCKLQRDLRWQRLVKKLELNNLKFMPSPPALPLIGHMHLLRDHQHNPWEGFNEIRKTYGDIVSLQMGIHPMVLVSKGETFREVLLQKGHIFINRPNFPRHHIVFGGDKENSLALCNWSDKHRDRRKMCKRGIVPNQLSSRNQLLENIVCKYANQYIEDIVQNRQIIHENQAELRTDKHWLVTKSDFRWLCADIFMEFLCNEKRSHQDTQFDFFVYGCDVVFWDINQSYLIDFLPFLTSLGVGHSYLKRLEYVTGRLRSFVDDEIFLPRHEKLLDLLSAQNKRLDDLKDIFADTQELVGGSDCDYLDSLILEYMSESTSMSLADYKVGFSDLLAGHSAVANMIMRLLGHLSFHQEYQDMIYEESKRVDIDKLDHKPSLPVTEAALQEALRLASSPIVPHVASEDTNIGDYYIPKNSVVLFNSYHLNMSDQYWDDPYEFNPLRFLEVVEKGDNNETEYRLSLPKNFMPFSLGRRQCLGYRMVESTTVATVANFCRRFVIKADDEDLVRRLLVPKGSLALDPDAKCFSFKLYPR